MDDLGSFLVRLEGVSIPIMAANVDYNKVKKDQQKMTQIKKMCQQKYCIA